ncbi:polysaccharide deacetylase family protein [Terriglobus roseus]|uniref:polysaccharide deacetylase family protein n=1 Tax=Terriglobus roseus TaxID=392734 RepID=UPI001E49880A|nr:polysaccharide deacetylase family protein [Terriglobus roseus]
MLTLHRVIPDDAMESCRSPHGMVIRESAFRSLLVYLSKNAVCVKPGDIDQPEGSSTRPRVLITFDDGWFDNLAIAAPLLAQFGMSACFFAVTNYAGRSQPFWPERALGLVRALHDSKSQISLRDLFSHLVDAEGTPLPAGPIKEEELLSWLKQFDPETISAAISDAERSISSPMTTRQPDPWERLMTWDEMHTLTRAGHTIGSHTATHALLTQLTSDEVASELLTSSTALEQHMVPEHTERHWIAYPNGFTDNRVRELTAKCGYHYGFTTVSGLWRKESEPLAIPRVNVWDGSVLSPEGTFDESYLEYTLFFRPLLAGSL